MMIFAAMLLVPLLQLPGPIGIDSKGACAGEGDIYRCAGGVVVTSGDIRVEADWFEHNRASQLLTAGDRVHFVRGEEDLRGGRLSINLETRTGTFADVSGQIEGFYVKAELYERDSDGSWKVSRPSATACSGDCAPWNFTFREARITPGKSFSGRNMVFRFQRVPVLWVPAFTIPTEKRERASGFLIPMTSTSTTKGRSLRGSFYWAMDRSYDATFGSEYFSKRGPSGMIDFRATPNDRTTLDVSTFFAFDKLGQGGNRTDIRTTTGFGRNWRGVANVDITSSFPFRQVYEEGFNVISSPIERSMGFLTNNRPRSSLNILYNRTAVFFPEGESSVALRTFPSVQMQIPTSRLSDKVPIYFSFESEFAGLARRDGAIDTGAFMQRVDVHPSLEIPLVTSGLLRWSHRIGVRDTLYTHSVRSGAVRDTLNRGVFEYSMQLGGPQIERDYGSWRHVIEPTIEYRNVSGVNRFRQTVIVDETDLLSDTNEIEYGVTNRFLAGHEFLTWRIAQKMYWNPTFGGALLDGHRNTLQPLMDLTGFAFSDGIPRRFSPIVSTFRIATSPQSSTDIQVDYDPQREEFRSAGIMGGVNRGPINSSIGYFFNQRSDLQSPNNQLGALLSYGSRQKRGLSAGFAFYYDIYRSIFQGSTSQVGYNFECYGLSFEFTQYDLGARKESRLRFSLSLKNLGSVGTLRPQERLF